MRPPDPLSARHIRPPNPSVRSIFCLHDPSGQGPITQIYMITGWYTQLYNTYYTTFHIIWYKGRYELQQHIVHVDAALNVEWPRGACQSFGQGYVRYDIKTSVLDITFGNVLKTLSSHNYWDVNSYFQFIAEVWSDKTREVRTANQRYIICPQSA